MSLIQHYECEILVTCGHHKAAIFELFLTGGLCKSNCPKNYYGILEMRKDMCLTYHIVERSKAITHKKRIFLVIFLGLDIGKRILCHFLE